VHAFVVATALVQLTGPAGHPLYLNPGEISSLRSPTDVSGGHLAPGVECVVIMTNGKANAVRQTCNQVEQLIAPSPPRSNGPCTLVCGDASRK
jgi:hypothetical protein